MSKYLKILNYIAITMNLNMNQTKDRNFKYDKSILSYPFNYFNIVRQCFYYYSIKKSFTLYLN